MKLGLALLLLTKHELGSRVNPSTSVISQASRATLSLTEPTVQRRETDFFWICGPRNRVVLGWARGPKQQLDWIWFDLDRKQSYINSKLKKLPATDQADVACQIASVATNFLDVACRRPEHVHAPPPRAATARTLAEPLQRVPETRAPHSEQGGWPATACVRVLDASPLPHFCCLPYARPS